MNARKGLGAQKIQMDFNKVEQEALQTETAKNGNDSGNNLSYEEQDKQLSSIKLAYDEKQKIVEKQLKSVPNKAAQIERLGIGFTNTGKSTKSHSAVSDMKVIKQDNANLSKPKDTLSNIDDFVFSSTQNKFKDFVLSNDNFWNDMGIVDKKVKKPQVFDSITTIDLDIKNKNKVKPDPSEENQYNRDSFNKNIKPNASTTDNSEAQKKFANAKAISSEQYFGGDQSNVISFNFYWNFFLFNHNLIGLN